ncbi:hypothetical protein DM02DRAFT_612456 [Periconia macrospinosa]|uniref:INO80 complex subunit B-like conserved region domain-containing protein n=1 Tax=Periconia macrospinosa TaxID=97972 RepID=A0A2V1DYU5_9PLEO|nr:hypothetical protein DM02DRAFT_612456 [Periconia macrospinosa]
MPDRSAKRLRRLSTDYEDSEGGNDWRHSTSNHQSAAPTASSTRPRRNAPARDPPAALIQRSSPEESRQSIHLTVKASPGKIRQATRGQAPATVSSRNIVAGKRSSRNSRTIQEVDSDDDDEEEEEEEAEEVDAMDVDEEEEEEEEDDAEGDEDEDMDAEGEEEDEIEVAPAPRIVVSTNKSAPAKPIVPQDSVEAKELALDDDDDDEELSELESEDEDAEGEDEDAEGEEDDEIRVANEDDDEDMDSDEDMSRDDTPDLSKMTRRQQAMVTEGTDELMSLSNEAQKKKHLTAEEHAMRRAEMARRRKNLSEKRNEEEKMDTINRLLKKQPPKRGRKSLLEITESGQEEEPEVEKANPLFVRYRQTREGASLGVPEEWLDAPVGSLFAGKLEKPAAGSRPPFSGRMVEEVA